MDSRTMKLQSLSAIYAREHSAGIFKEMMEEMASMKRYDEHFNLFSKKLELNGQYNAKSINFKCLRESINAY